MGLEQWIGTKFIEPLCKYYTTESTIVYGILLAVIAYGTYRMLKKLKLKIDTKLFVAVFPFILFGGVTRALKDHGIFYTSDIFCSPPIYFIVFAIALSSLLIGIYTKRKWNIPYHQVPFLIGMVLLAFDFSLVVIKNFSGIFLIGGITVLWSTVVMAFSKLKPKMLPRVNAGILLAHLFDASSTFVAMTFFGYYEQHVVPGYLIGMFGPAVFFPLKIIVVLSVLYLIDKYSDDRYFANFLKLVIVILGLAMGTRGFMTVGMLQV